MLVGCSIIRMEDTASVAFEFVVCVVAVVGVVCCGIALWSLYTRV